MRLWASLDGLQAIACCNSPAVNEAISEFEALRQSRWDLKPGYRRMRRVLWSAFLLCKGRGPHTPFSVCARKRSSFISIFRGFTAYDASSRAREKKTYGVWYAKHFPFVRGFTDADFVKALGLDCICQVVAKIYPSP
ncbi:hypothetical protein PoB_007623600 [Plakobranchus ocellatus]|uniref:Uncharacterized protein n=1 Tax=Plakobranchus ocellatus TaxID=259542 RepID=A0AAV4E087_9GAST|nr:hypothetical protein PoB_007623600 [Plakobranchus ocellatus]